MDVSQSQAFHNLLLRHRARSGLTQRQLADRTGVGLRSVQDWEAGATYPGADRLEALLLALLESHALTPGFEAAEAQTLWSAVERQAPRMRAPFDHARFAALLAQREPPPMANASPADGSTAPSAGGVGAGIVAERRQDWGEAPDPRVLVGRGEELATLRGWVVDDECRLVALQGLGGIGKTYLAAKVAYELAPSFERVYWRNMRDAPATSEWLAGAIGFLSDQQLVASSTTSERLQILLDLLRERRSLLVLDNFETLLEAGERRGDYRLGCEGYGTLLQAIAERTHRSCLLVTSREEPGELVPLKGSPGVRTLTLGGLSVADSRSLLIDKQLSGDEVGWAHLVARYGGNSLALKVVGDTIHQVFNGGIAEFLEYNTSTYGVAHRGIRTILDAQLKRRLSALEQELLRWLAVEREPRTVRELFDDVGQRVSRGDLIAAVETLRRRSLLEQSRQGRGFTLHSVVLEYVTEQLVEGVAEEIDRSEPNLLAKQPLIQAQTKEYVRESQERLIGGPILQRLTEHGDSRATEERLIALLDSWRGRPLDIQGYGPGNVVNLLRLLRGHMRGLDLSRLALRQAYLAEVQAPDASLAGAHLERTVLSDAFSQPVSLTLSGDGALLVAGTSTGQVWLWRAADRTLSGLLNGHTGPALGVALANEAQL
ncbi:MAG: NACHT domain-containing protein, partial [Chloroflexi bacterium]|nr:NACHT domain-containing protein [Chloroflexota bacterium]